MSSPSTKLCAPTNPHRVKFYGSEASLFHTVGEFIGDGLLDGQPAIMLVSAAHQEGMLAELCARGIDVQAARQAGHLVVLEAEEILPLLMIDGAPDADLFDQHVGRLVEQTMRGRGPVVARAYGELVDLLWKAGQADAAITLEMFWNRLALRNRFTLLCGYSMGHFYKEGGRVDEVIAQHTHFDWDMGLSPAVAAAGH